MRAISLVFLSFLILSQLSLAEETQKIPDFPPAPAWTLKDAEGKTVSLSDYKGKAVFLHFWATWCPYCKKVQPGLTAIYKKYQDQGFELIGISIQEDKGAKPQKVLDDRGNKFKTLLFGEEVANAYAVKGTPTTYFIDKKGRIIGGSNSSDPEDPLWEEAATYMLALDQ